MTVRGTTLSVLVAASAVTLITGCTTTPAATTPATTPAATSPAGPAPVATAQLVNPAGAPMGTVEFREADGGLEVRASVDGLEPGFHALHVHAIGTCEANSADPANPSNTGNFLSAGGHLTAQGMAHPDHVGDLPALQADANGAAALTSVSDRLTAELMLDDDGAAVVVHASEDNFANIPPRYAPGGADEETQKAGDAGGRVLCGVVTQE